jgi:hypothetical protein
MPGDPGFDSDALDAGGGSVSVVLVDAPRTRAENEAIRDEVMDATDLPVDVYAAGLRPDGSGVDVIAEGGDIAAAQAALDRRYGPGTVLIEKGRVIPA